MDRKKMKVGYIIHEREYGIVISKQYFICKAHNPGAMLGAIPEISNKKRRLWILQTARSDLLVKHRSSQHQTFNTNSAGKISQLPMSN